MGVRRRLPHSFLCLMKTDFSEQVEKLRKEITAAIKAVLEKYGKTEMEFPDTVDAVYVIWFDHDGDPYECLVRRIQFFGEDLHLVVENKHSHDLYEIDGPFEPDKSCTVVRSISSSQLMQRAPSSKGQPCNFYPIQIQKLNKNNDGNNNH